MDDPAAAVANRRAPRLPQLLATKALVAAVAAVVGLLVTGWLIGALAAGLAGWAAVNAWDGAATTRRGGEQQRIEALAVWCEQLRDLLSADIGIIGTIDAIGGHGAGGAAPGGVAAVDPVGAPGPPVGDPPVRQRGR